MISFEATVLRNVQTMIKTAPLSEQGLNCIGRLREVSPPSHFEPEKGLEARVCFSTFVVHDKTLPLTGQRAEFERHLRTRLAHEVTALLMGPIAREVVKMDHALKLHVPLTHPVQRESERVLSYVLGGAK